MSLSLALSNAYSGLKATSRQAETAAHNVANANTEGYARRSVDLQASITDNRGTGVRVAGVAIAENPALTFERRRADAAFAEQEQLAAGKALIARIVGDPDEPGSLFDRYEALETTLRTLSGDPAASHLQLDVLSKAEDLTRGFTDAQKQLQDARLDIDAEIGRTISDANRLLAEIHTLNTDTRREAAQGLDATETDGRRNALLDQLADLVPIKTYRTDDGRVRVTTESGYTLVGDRPVTLDFSNAASISPSMDLIGGAPGALSGLEIDGVDVTPPATQPATITGGKISALFETRDVDMVRFQRQLDALATDLVERFADPAVEPTAGAGNPGIITDAGGLPAGTPGIAGRLAINAAVDPAQGGALYRLRDGVGAVAEGDAGANAHVTALLGALTSSRTAPAGSLVSGAPTASGLAAALGSMISTESVSADAATAMRSARRDTLVQQEGRSLGVDIDYELQSLTAIQNAYAANARVMEVINELYQRLLQI